MTDQTPEKIETTTTTTETTTLPPGEFVFAPITQPAPVVQTPVRDPGTCPNGHKTRLIHRTLDNTTAGVDTWNYYCPTCGESWQESAAAD